MTQVALASIRLDGGTQSRAELSEATIAEYAEAIEGGAKFPPPVAFYDGVVYWLADGFHRVHAHLKAKRKQIVCDVRQGSQRDAILFSVGANDSHGLRRTNADKRRAVELLLRDDEWSKKSDNWVATTVRVDHKTVTKVRDDLGIPKSNVRSTAGGRDVDTSKIGRKPSESVAIEPAAEPTTVALDPEQWTCPVEGCGKPWDREQSVKFGWVERGHCGECGCAMPERDGENVEVEFLAPVEVVAQPGSNVVELPRASQLAESHETLARLFESVTRNATALKGSVERLRAELKMQAASIGGAKAALVRAEILRSKVVIDDCVNFINQQESA